MISSKATAPAQIMLNYPKSAGTIAGGQELFPLSSFRFFLSHISKWISPNHPFFLEGKVPKIRPIKNVMRIQEKRVRMKSITA
jgi:hypothetical protein